MNRCQNDTCSADFSGDIKLSAGILDEIDDCID